QFRKLLLGRQEHSLADDVVLLIEQAVDGLEAEVRHPDPVSVREGERDAQTIAVWLLDVANLFRKGSQCALAPLPGLHVRIRPTAGIAYSSGSSSTTQTKARIDLILGNDQSGC